MGRLTIEQFSKYVGLPYREFNCWGLVAYFYDKEYGLTLDTPYDVNLEKKHAKIESVNKYKITINPEPGDIILFNVLGSLSHVGIYIDETFMLHSDSGHDACIEKWASIKWKSRVHGFYKAVRTNVII